MIWSRIEAEFVWVSDWLRPVEIPVIPRRDDFTEL
jgi:hypothetical protein